MNESVEAPNTEAMSDLRCASCPAVLEVIPGVDQRGQLCADCNAKLQALVESPEPPPPAPHEPRDPGDIIPASPMPAGVMEASAEKEPELEKALEEAKAPARAPDPVLMSEEEARSILQVDIMGNGAGYIISASANGKILPYASGLQVAFMPTGISAVFGVPTAFLDGPEVPASSRRIQITTMRVAVRKMLMCTRPSSLRLKRRGDEWWGAAVSMLHNLDDIDRFDFAPAPPETPAAPPETEKETADGQSDPPTAPEPQP